MTTIGPTCGQRWHRARAGGAISTNRHTEGVLFRFEGVELDTDAFELRNGGVRVPTLVVHCRDDMATPYAEGRRLAGLIPDAEFITLESSNHILTADEPAWADFLNHFDHFVTS